MALISVTYKFPPSALNATRKGTGKAKKKKSEQKLKKRRNGDIQLKGITLKCKRHITLLKCGIMLTRPPLATVLSGLFSQGGLDYAIKCYS